MAAGGGGIAVLTRAAAVLAALLLAGCGGDGDDVDDSAGEQTGGLFTTTPEGTVTSEKLDRWFARFDAACSEQPHGSKCVAFMEMACGEVDEAPKIFCNTAEDEIFGPPKATQEEPAEPPEEAAEGDEEAVAVGETAEGLVLAGGPLDATILVDIEGEPTNVSMPAGAAGGRTPQGRTVEVERTEDGWEFVRFVGAG